MKKKYLECGKIVTTHGVAGEVRLQPWCDEAEELSGIKKLYLDAEGKQPIRIVRARPHKNMVILKIKDVDTVEQAVLYRNRVLYVDRNSLNLEEGEYFVQDLLGMKVYDVDNGKFYGTLTDVLETGANNVYELTCDDGSKKLVPAIPQVVIERDVDAETMKIRPLKGLFDDED